MSATAGTAPAAKSTAGPLDYFLLVVLATLWGAAYSLIRIAVETVPPLTLITVRTIIAGGLLCLLMKINGIAMPRDRTTWRNFMFQAAFNSTLPFAFIAWAEQTVSSGLATILNSTAPIFAFLINWGLVRVERPTARKLMGAIAGIIGVVLIVGFQALEGLGQGFMARVGLVFASVCYASAALFGRNFGKLHPLVPAAGSLICGLVVLIPLSLAFERPWDLHPSIESLVAMVALAVFTTALALIIYFRLLVTLGAVATTAQAYLRVPIGVGIGVVFLGETLPSTAWIGFACVVFGVAAMTIPERSRR